MCLLAQYVISHTLYMFYVLKLLMVIKALKIDHQIWLCPLHIIMRLP